MAELVALVHRKGRPPLMVDVARSSRLRRGVAHHFGSLTVARRAARISEPRRRHKWDEGRIVREIRRLHRQAVRITRPSLAKAGRHDLLCAIDEIGGIQVARRRARIPEPKPLSVERTAWDDERVILEILERHDRGESLAYTKVSAALRFQGWRRFGSWREAVVAAGLDYDQVRLTPRWDDESLVAALWRLRRDRPAMGRGELGAHVIGHRASIHFGSLDRALEVAEIHDWPERTRVPISRREVLAELRRRAGRGASVKRGDLVGDDPRLAHAVRRFYSSFSDALVAARVVGARRSRRWSSTQVLEALRERYATGQPMTSRAVEQADHPLFKAAKRRFGNWSRVLIAAGISVGKKVRRGA